MEALTDINTQNTGSLSDLLESGTGNELTLNTLVADNMGNKTFLFQLPMKTFYERSAVANERDKNSETIAQRPLNIPHASKLAKYMLKGLIHAAKVKRQKERKQPSTQLEKLEKILGRQPYVSIQPIVCNLRNINPDLKNLRAERVISLTSNETACFKVWLPSSQLMYVIDGQHRRKAMQLLFDFLQNAISSHMLNSKNNLLLPKKGELSQDLLSALIEIQDVASTLATVQIECHIGLDSDQERQLFHDLNNLGKKVESSLALQFDNSNPINVYIKEVLIDDNSILDWNILEQDIVDWKNDDGSISRKDLVSINARLFLNKTNISGASPNQIEPKIDEINKFWESICKIPSLGKEGAKLNTVAAQPVMLKALAKLFYDFSFGRKAEANLQSKLLENIPLIDFSHTNPIWRYYQLSQIEIIDFNLDKLEEYLPSNDEGVNRDIGLYDSNAQTMRFGAKSNDIYPILGDMIRWSIGLPNRHTK